MKPQILTFCIKFIFQFSQFLFSFLAVGFTKYFQQSTTQFYSVSDVRWQATWFGYKYKIDLSINPFNICNISVVIYISSDY